MNQSAEIKSIRDLYIELTNDPKEYDFMPPSFISHVPDYRQDVSKLKIYAKQVISSRIVMLMAFSRMNTQSLLHCYISGIDSNNPLSLLMSARSQLELLSVVIDTVKIISDNAGEHADNFAARVQRVDEALIKATFGTRSDGIKKLFDSIPLSNKRSATSEEKSILDSKNILSRLDKIDKLIPYESSRQDYERLCEYVHPNFGMNMLRVVPSSKDSRFLKFSLTSEIPMDRAISASANCMAQASRGVIRSLQFLQPPFGAGIVSYI